MKESSELPKPLISFLSAWEQRDLEGLVAHWSENCELVDPADPLTGGEIVRGRDAMRSYYRQLWRQIPDASLFGISAIADQHGLAWLWRFTGSSDGRGWSAAGASYFRLDPDGLILSDHAVWDSTVMG
jgi:ketosteroid isomerase-like protein